LLTIRRLTPDFLLRHYFSPDSFSFFMRLLAFTLIRFSLRCHYIFITLMPLPLIDGLTLFAG
jgi:hypothetical protein